MAQSSPRSSSGKAPARPRAKGGSNKSAQAPQPEATQPGFLARFFSALGRAGVGAVRAWKATDLQVKRDAAAFVAVAAAIVIALREWFQISGEAGDAIHHASAGLFGIFSVVLPLVLIALAVELVSARSGRSALPHHVAGGIGITAALTGLVHISRGNPAMGTDPGIEAAGGLLGWFVARPLALLLSGWGAGALMILLLAYSILLATRTAVADVPARLRDIAAHLSGERPEGDAETADQAGGDPAKEARRRARKDLAAGDDAFLDEYDGDESFRKATDSDSAAVGTPSSTSTPTPPPAAPETPSVRPSAAPPVAPPPASPTFSDDDDETPRRSGGGMKWALGLLALVIAGCAAGGYYYYDHYLAAPAPAEEKAMARPDTTPAKPAPVADNEAEMREKVITYWDVYAKRSSGLIIQYSNAQLRKMLEAKGFVLKTDNSADNASAEGEAQPEQSQVYELTTNKGEVLCRFVLNNDRVYNELWFKYPEDKAAFVKGAAASGFKAGTSADRETKVPTYYSSFASDSVRTYPNTRHDYIVAGNETLKLCRERER